MHDSAQHRMRVDEIENEIGVCVLRKERKKVIPTPTPTQLNTTPSE